METASANYFSRFLPAKERREIPWKPGVMKQNQGMFLCLFVLGYDRFESADKLKGRSQ